MSYELWGHVGPVLLACFAGEVLGCYLAMQYWLALLPLPSAPLYFRDPFPSAPLYFMKISRKYSGALHYTTLPYGSRL